MAEMAPAARKIFEHQYDVMIECGCMPDTSILRAYAIARAEYEESQAQIDANGAVVRIGANVRESPYVGIRDRALEAMERLSDRLGLGNLPVLPAERHKKDNGLRMEMAESAISAALDQANGVISHAAAILGVSMTFVSGRIHDSGALAAQIQDIEHRTIEWATATVRKAVQRGDTKVAMWLLETKGGYTRKVDFAAQGRVSVLHDLSRLSDEQIDNLEQLALLALPGPDQSRETETVDRGEPEPL